MRARAQQAMGVRGVQATRLTLLWSPGAEEAAGERREALSRGMPSQGSSPASVLSARPQPSLGWLPFL